MFSSYLNFTYFFDIYKQWYFNDINDFQLYDFIIGKYHINVYFLYTFYNKQFKYNYEHVKIN